MMSEINNEEESTFVYTRRFTSVDTKVSSSSMDELVAKYASEAIKRMAENADKDGQPWDEFNRTLMLQVKVWSNKLVSASDK